MTIHRLLPLLALTAILVLVAAACGGNGGDGDGGGEAVERPAPGEYLFDVDATIEFTLTEPAVSAAAVGPKPPHLAWGTGTATVKVTEPPEGGDEEVISGSFGGIKLEVTIKDGDIEIIQTGEDSAPLRMSRGTGAVPRVTTELMPSTITVNPPVGDALMNADSVHLESIVGCSLGEACTLRTPGLAPELPRIRLQAEDGIDKGEIESVILELTPTNGQVQDGADEEPATDEVKEDPKNDWRLNCDLTAAPDPDGGHPAMDIRGVARRGPGEVDIVLGDGAREFFQGNPPSAFKEIFLLTPDGRAFRAGEQIHAGERSTYVLDEEGSPVPGAQVMVEWIDEKTNRIKVTGLDLPEGTKSQVHVGVIPPGSDKFWCDVEDD